ncbi:Cytochrome P450 monooxygenase tcpC [Paramyrothecium foliicola]|nr:Cytochrome P450 monooxygenase tcpC [Paramyrothecium foliicola]
MSVLTKPEDVKAFHTDSADHEKSEGSNGGWLFHQLLGDCMGLINGTRWKKVRANFHSYFTHGTVAQNGSEISTAVKDYIKQLEAQSTGSLELHADNTARFPFMATAEHLYGPLTHDEKEELWTLGQRSLGMMGSVLAGGAYRFKLYPLLKPETYKRFRKFEDDWTAFNQRICDTRRSHTPQPPIVEAWRAVEIGEVSKKEAIHSQGVPQAVQTMSEMLFANLDVSTHVLGWLLVFIAQHSSIQQQLRQEMADQVDKWTEYCGKKDTLLHLCFLESLRLRPFTVFSIPESSPSVKILGGYTIPANLRYNLFSFGFGSRKCLGQHFGEMMLKLFLCRVVHDYDMKLSEAEKQKGLHEKAGKDTWVPITDLRSSKLLIVKTKASNAVHCPGDSGQSGDSLAPGLQIGPFIEVQPTRDGNRLVRQRKRSKVSNGRSVRNSDELLVRVAETLLQEVVLRLDVPQEHRERLANGHVLGHLEEQPRLSGGPETSSFMMMVFSTRSLPMYNPSLSYFSARYHKQEELSKTFNR